MPTTDTHAAAGPGLDAYRSAFRRLNGGCPPWLQRVRSEGIERFAALGFPTLRMEDWKYTSVAPIARTPFRLAPPQVRIGADEVAPLGFGTSTCMVFVNGRFAPALSRLADLPPGVRVQSLAAAWATDAGAGEAHLARLAGGSGDAFTALNAAFLEDGALVHIPRGGEIDEPIHLLFVSDPSAPGTVAHPRVLVVAGEHSRATVIESYAGRGDHPSFTNAVSELYLGAGATLRHYKIQRERPHAFHVGRIEARQERDSDLKSCAVSLGAALARSDINTALAAPGARCTMDGLYLAAGTQHVDHHTAIDHQQPHCTSAELYKGVLDGRATGVFNGKVVIRPHAQKSDAGQSNKNLLLSQAAVVNTKPQLEIFADDVKCSHGATIGRLDEEAIFYLRSRGLDAAAARSVLIYAFANEIIERVHVESVRAELDAMLQARFSAAFAPQASR